MRKKIGLLVLIVLLAPLGAHVEVVSQNPNAIISIVGPDAFSIGKPGEALREPFVVRIVDPQGQPIEGLTVDFFANASACLPLLPGCVNPPPEMYGDFPEGVNGESILTDANGYAVSGIFHGGTVAGTYDVAAHAFLTSSARNWEVLKTFPTPDAMFSITQFGPTAAAPVPAGSAMSAWMLAAAVVLAALRALCGRASRSNRLRGSAVTSCSASMEMPQ